MSKNIRGFASDNNAGVHRNVLEYIEKANVGHQAGYGDDEYTQRAIELFKEHFGSQAEVFFVFNGTGANVLSIEAFAQAHHTVLCPSTAHIMVDECGAPEKFVGCKVIPIPTLDGKLTPELVKPYLHGFGFVHHSQPRIISITQVSEVGTLYTPDEIRALADLAHAHGMILHMDGARLSNAAAALDLSFKEFTTDCGVDVLSFGGTKNGLMMGEAVVVLNGCDTESIQYMRKQSAQLFSKMRFVAAQFLAYFNDDLWKKNALHSNRMAKLLAQKVENMGIELTQKVESNGVFAIIPDSVRDELCKSFLFYSWDESRHEVRWMTSFDTTDDDIEQFCDQLSLLMKKFGR